MAVCDKNRAKVNQLSELLNGKFGKNERQKKIISLAMSMQEYNETGDRVCPSINEHTFRLITSPLDLFSCVLQASVLPGGLVRSRNFNNPRAKVRSAMHHLPIYEPLSIDPLLDRLSFTQLPGEWQTSKVPEDFRTRKNGSKGNAKKNVQESYLGQLCRAKGKANGEDLDEICDPDAEAEQAAVQDAEDSS